MTSPASRVSLHDTASTGHAFETAWSFLRVACSEGGRSSNRIAPLCSTVQWRTLFDLADRHSVQPLLYQALSTLPASIPSAEMHVMEKLYQTNLHKALILSRELIHIVDRLTEVGIEVMPYKGLALAESIYGDIASRQAGDIDLLIHGRDLARIRATVAELGYVPHRALSAAEEHCYLQSGYECAFDGAAGRNLLEVQWAIQPQFYAVDFDHESLFRRAISITVAGHPMRTPSNEDLFLILSLHAAKHVWGRLIWLCDIARIMRLPGLKWDWIGSQAKDMGIVRLLRVTLLLAKRLLNAEIPAAAETGLPQDIEAHALADEMETQIASGKIYDVESRAYFRLMLRLRERWPDRAHFLSRLMLTPGPGEWAAVRLPRPLFPLYRLVRICRLAGRLVRA